jgi:predicted ATP-dependent serine protease
VSKDLEPIPGEPAEELPPLPTFVEVLGQALEKIERIHEDHREVTGVPTGFPDLDRLTGGLQPGNLVVISARPSVGKTVLAIDIARHATVRAGVPTLFCTFELTRSEISQRLTKEYGSSWIFERCLTWANVLQRVQRSAFSLVCVLSVPLTFSAFALAEWKSQIGLALPGLSENWLRPQFGWMTLQFPMSRSFSRRLND